MNSLKFVLFLIILSIGCGVPKNVEPSAEQLANADYGPKPNNDEIPEMVRRFLKRGGYFDPNGAEIEGCTEPRTVWLDEFDCDGGPDYNPTGKTEFIFAWESRCDINSKNRMGGFTGFRRESYTLKNGKVVCGYIPTSTNLTRVTPLGGVLGGMLGAN